MKRSSAHELNISMKINVLVAVQYFLYQLKRLVPILRSACAAHASLLLYQHPWSNRGLNPKSLSIFLAFILVLLFFRQLLTSVLNIDLNHTSVLPESGFSKCGSCACLQTQDSTLNHLYACSQSSQTGMTTRMLSSTPKIKPEKDSNPSAKVALRLEFA